MLWTRRRSVLRALVPVFYFIPSIRAAPTDSKQSQLPHLTSAVRILSVSSTVPSAASFYVSNLPDLHQDENSPLHIFSGHISSDPDADKASSTDVTAHLFFVMVKNRRIADKERIMFWFNVSTQFDCSSVSIHLCFQGGPGCSSFDGLMMEVGPWRVDGNGGLKIVEGGWEEYTTMVYGRHSFPSWFYRIKLLKFQQWTNLLVQASHIPVPINT